MVATEFSPGFRITALDAVILLACAIGSTLAAHVEWWLGLIVAFATIHFFLFCDVFRVQRPFELGWAILFVLLAGSTITFHIPGWSVTIASSLIATVALVTMEMRKLSYHGIFWQRINPRLFTNSGSRGDISAIGRRHTEAGEREHEQIVRRRAARRG